MGIRTRRAHLHSRTHAVGFGIAGFFGFIALLIAALSISLGALISQWLQDLPDYSSADSYLVAEPTTVYDGQNNVIAEYYLQNRRSITIDQISPYVLKGVVDTEDVRFYQHNGVDPQGILRAAVAQLTGGSEGASTITQQLVRNTVLSDEQFEMSLKRKVREAYIAIQMEKMYTKDQILNMYLNTIFFGHGAYGIQAASITYFNKNASDLTLNEAATLAGLAQAPSAYDPFVNPDAATARRNKVLERMLAAGDITQEEHDATVNEPVVTEAGSFSDSTGSYPYFSDYVKQLLLEDFDQDTVLQGGLKVYTTLDPLTQKAAEDAVETRLDEIGNDRLQSGLVAVDPSNGYIKAMVGGRSYEKSQFNLAAQAYRQPGSSFKLFTLVAALQEGMSPNIYINCNSPMRFSPFWEVGNFGNISYGNISLAQAFAVSSNTGFVQVIQAIGADRVVSMAHSLGIDVDIPAYDSITLGTEGVPVVQMAEAYATIAAGGVHRDAIAITKIEDRNGNTVYEHKDDPAQVVSKAVATAAIDVMEGVTSGSGTASSLRSSVTVDQPIGGKTGTSENYRDLWFCGITPQLSVAIWCGYTQEDTVRVYGSYGHPYNTSVPIFAYFINEALKDEPRGSFPTTSELPNYKSNSNWTFKGGSNLSEKRSYEETSDEDSSTETRNTTRYTNSQTTGDTQTNSGTSDGSGNTNSNETSNGGGTGNNSGSGTAGSGSSEDGSGSGDSGGGSSSNNPGNNDG